MSDLPQVVQSGPSLPAAANRESAGVLLSVIQKLIDDKDLDFARVKEAVDLYERLERRRMETEYNAAMSEAQAKIVPVVTNRRNLHTKSNYADLAAIASAAMPVIHAAGFGITFSEFKSLEPNCFGVRAEVMHRAGFAKVYEFNVPIDGAGMKGGVNKTDIQAYGSTQTYGRRYAICMIFNIPIADEDGNRQPESSPNITVEQIAEIKALLGETNSNLTLFLGTLASVNKLKVPFDTLEQVPQSLFLSAKGLLIQKRNELAKRSPAGKPEAA